MSWSETKSHERIQTLSLLALYQMMIEPVGDFLILHVSISDIDDCLNSPCANEGTCTDQVDSFACTCRAGFTGQTCGTGKCDKNSIFLFLIAGLPRLSNQRQINSLCKYHGIIFQMISKPFFFLSFLLLGCC